MAEEGLDEVRACLAGDERAGGVAQRVEAQGAQAGGVAGAGVAATDGGAVEAPANARLRTSTSCGRDLACR